MKVDRFDNGDEYLTVETPSDLQGWKILAIEPWKKGVVRLHCRSDDNLRILRLLYCPTSISDEVSGLRLGVVE